MIFKANSLSFAGFWSRNRYWDNKFRTGLEHNVCWRGSSSYSYHADSYRRFEWWELNFCWSRCWSANI